MNLGLQGKVAIVTGASRGIGNAIAHGLADEGCKLTICARGEEALASAAAALREKGAEVVEVCLDITDADAGEMLTQKTLDAYGSIDVFVGNAGGNRRGQFADTSDQDWQDIIELNLKSHLNTSRAVLPTMKQQGSGSIIFITSIFGREAGGPGLSIYNSTKSALISASKIMAVELAADGIRVNSVAPGSIRFPGGSWDKRCISDPEGMKAFIGDNIPLGRFGKAEEVADAVTYLSSDRASWISGTCIPVDGVQSKSLI
ncbi:MAG: SDR family oxidoreductase [Bacteroidetes Order II. Incertae sedis bacterium]|jgi:3-oxoacyl-[acyl-carrier protein] reductase|nr:SDR family oxidoreductase [Bacteroidetes Order II. bacterium]MBT4051904.1 SDR family oxidoreductase [Bacteroidetes Order II. bacterium]MBT4601557.1 SDR family oxidoreductase [Bacteroidetes Order II. bacterium]MBT5250979.1 SDR family oxidoreductase [Bacteroidetes Order II. bacterium]MBT6201342.1 SDR family oxidoreductase [Bacteroidetes Order II. bacterium]